MVKSGQRRGNSVLFVLCRQHYFSRLTIVNRNIFNVSNDNDITSFFDINAVLINHHRTSGQLEMAKKYPMDFEGAMRTPSPRASK